MGMLASVKDACNRFLGVTGTGSQPERCVSHLDSMLVTKQGSFLKRCLSDDLAPYYEQVIGGLRSPERDGIEVTVMRNYREFNALADGLANEVLNLRQNISENWMQRIGACNVCQRLGADVSDCF